jgi:hypothetical protein
MMDPADAMSHVIIGVNIQAVTACNMSKVLKQNISTTMQMASETQHSKPPTKRFAYDYFSVRATQEWRLTFVA